MRRFASQRTQYGGCIQLSSFYHDARFTAESRCTSLRENVQNEIIQKSKNYKVPTKAGVIKWANVAWDSNELDEEMAVYDDLYDEVWKAELQPDPQHVEESMFFLATPSYPRWGT